MYKNIHLWINYDNIDRRFSDILFFRESALRWLMAENIIEMRSVSVVRSGKYILKDIDLDITDSENLAIIGPNGSGKTSFVKLITGENKPYYDENGKTMLRLFGKERWNIFELRNKIGIVSMDLQSRFADTVKVYEVIASGFFGSMDIFRDRIVTDDMMKAVYESALRLGIESILERDISNLSLGEMRRALIARALISNPKLLVLDEPMTGLDVVMKDLFRRMFDILSADGVRIVMITHDLEDIPSCVDRIIMIKEGEKIADGPKSELLTSSRLSELYDADIEVTKDDRAYHMRIKGGI